MESCNKLLTEELTQAKSTNENLTKTLEDTQNQNKVHRDDTLLYEILLNWIERFLYVRLLLYVNRPC